MSRHQDEPRRSLPTSRRHSFSPGSRYDYLPPLSRHLDGPSDSEHRPRQPRKTRAMTVIGRGLELSPERYTHDVIDSESDVSNVSRDNQEKLRSERRHLPRRHALGEAESDQKQRTDDQESRTRRPTLNVSDFYKSRHEGSSESVISDSLSKPTAAKDISSRHSQSEDRRYVSSYQAESRPSPGTSSGLRRSSYSTSSDKSPARPEKVSSRHEETGPEGQFQSRDRDKPSSDRAQRHPRVASPPSSFRKPMSQIEERLRKTHVSSSGRRGSSESVLSSRRGSNTSSIRELVEKKFAFDGVIVRSLERGDSDTKIKTTPVNALVDTGCDVNLILYRALTRAGISHSQLEPLNGLPDFEGFQGKKYNLFYRIELKWGKAKYAGSKSQRDIFYLVDKLPNDLEMVIGADYFGDELLRLINHRKSAR